MQWLIAPLHSYGSYWHIFYRQSNTKAPAFIMHIICIRHGSSNRDSSLPQRIGLSRVALPQLQQKLTEGMRPL